MRQRHDTPIHPKSDPARVRLTAQQIQPNRLEMGPPPLHLLRYAVHVPQPPLERFGVENGGRPGLVIGAVHHIPGRMDRVGRRLADRQLFLLALRARGCLARRAGRAGRRHGSAGPGPQHHLVHFRRLVHRPVAPADRRGGVHHHHRHPLRPEGSGAGQAGPRSDRSDDPRQALNQKRRPPQEGRRLLPVSG